MLLGIHRKKTGKIGQFKGFSLVEIVIAVAVVGIMSAAAVPIVQSTLNRSKVNRTKQDLSGIRTVFLQAIADGRDPSVLNLTTASSTNIHVAKGSVFLAPYNTNIAQTSGFGTVYQLWSNGTNSVGVSCAQCVDANNSNAEIKEVFNY